MRNYSFLQQLLEKQSLEAIIKIFLRIAYLPDSFHRSSRIIWRAISFVVIVKFRVSLFLL